jgi:RimJ/RimL family protein N-acetyltransferase
VSRARVLRPGDEADLERFLARHADVSMFLRSNLRRAGLVDRGGPYEGTYAAAFEGDEMVGAAAHYWNGMLIVAAPAACAEVAQVAAAASGREVEGLLGAWNELGVARRALGLAAARTRLDSREQLFALDLAELRVPPALGEGRAVCRPPRSAELPLLAEWAAAYGVETLGEGEGPEQRRAAREQVERARAEGRQWVLQAQGRLVACSAFNAVLPDCVQVGGVFTPPGLRGRGHGRCVVAGSLLAARAGGARRSILFTDRENRAAQTAYRALGYERVGEYGIVAFARPERA